MRGQFVDTLFLRDVMPRLATKRSKARNVWLLAIERFIWGHVDLGAPRASHRVLDALQELAPKIFGKLILREDGN